jgi:uncharacterized protein
VTATGEAATCACGAAYKPGAAFCARCGTRREPVATAPPRAAGLPIAIAYYLTLLVAQVIAMVNIKLGGDVFATMWVVTLGFAIVTLGFAIPNHALVLPLLGRAGFRPLGYLVLLALAPVIVALIHGYVRGLGILFDLEQPGELDSFGSHGIGIAILLVAIVPPVVEEIGFRGVIFGALRRNLRFSEALVISSFASAFAHLSVPSILTHAPLGFYLCWLRYRSNSLWPPMFAHACHNLGVIAWATYGS